MEQRIVSQENNRYIYFIRENQVSFYLVITHSADVNLVLNLIDNVNDDVVKQLRCPSGQVFVCPVVSSESLNGLVQNQADAYQSVDFIFSSALNLSHQILSYNKLNVNQVVYLKNHPNYAVFCDWFSKKYNGRVRLIEEERAAVSTPVVQESNPASVEQTVQTPVAENEVLSDDNHVTSEGSLGFVSYVLLGVVVAVMSLVFLYFIL